MSTKKIQLTAVIERDNDMYVAHCPEVDAASQGKTIEEARANLPEAVELFWLSGTLRGNPHMWGVILVLLCSFA